MSDCTSGFINGRSLSRAFWAEAVAPTLGVAFPGLTYAAGLLGPGSDVLGYDTARSTDHDWGPRCTLVLSEKDERSIGHEIETALKTRLPTTFRGYPVFFQEAPDDPGVTVPADPESGVPAFHRVLIFSIPSFLTSVGLEPHPEMDTAFWLSITGQQLLECTAGPLFRDDDGQLTEFRTRLAVYPEDVWRYRMAAMWMRISQIEPFIGRTGEAGDEMGSSIIAARLAEDVMRLALLQERQYAPYSKWLGTAFSRIESAASLGRGLALLRSAKTWQEREDALVTATSLLVKRHNALNITPPLDPAARFFHSRPFKVIEGERVSKAIMATLQDSPLARLPAVIGGIDEFMDSTDALKSGWLRRAIRVAMRESMQPKG